MQRNAFTRLTEKERFYGVEPSRLRKLNFPENKECKKIRSILRQFFCGCKLAATKEEFQDACKTLLYKQETPDVVVQAISFALLSKLPSYRRLDINTPLAFKNFREKEDFVYLNNFITSSKGHLLHPSRSSELIELLKGEEIASQLSRYHFLGNESLKISRLQSNVQFYPEKKSEIEKKICLEKQRFDRKKAILAHLPTEFEPGDFSFHLDPLYMFLLTKAYNYIERVKAWDYFETDDLNWFITDRVFLEHFDVLSSMVKNDQDHLAMLLEWIRKVKNTRWVKLVKDYQDELEKSVGMMTRVKRYVPLDQ